MFHGAIQKYKWLGFFWDTVYNWNGSLIRLRYMECTVYKANELALHVVPVQYISFATYAP